MGTFVSRLIGVHISLNSPSKTISIINAILHTIPRNLKKMGNVSQNTQLGSYRDEGQPPSQPFFPSKNKGQNKQTNKDKTQNNLVLEVQGSCTFGSALSISALDSRLLEVRMNLSGQLDHAANCRKM